MPGTFTRLLYHIVCSTKHRANLIAAELQPQLHQYLGGIIRGERGVTHEIGVVADHVHLLIQWRSDEALATLMRQLNANSSRLLHAFFLGASNNAPFHDYDYLSIGRIGSYQTSQRVRDIYVPSEFTGPVAVR